MSKPKKQKHNYTSELELKSLLIRIKNYRAKSGSFKYNTRINKYIKWYTKVSSKKYDNNTKRNFIKQKLKSKIISLSEVTKSDKKSYERFGKIILLMVKNILKKPQFSGYTYKDDFYSDAVYKILKYLDNFDHTLISDRTNLAVNAFAYISQIIHNSIIFIINTKKKDNEKLRNHITTEYDNYDDQMETHVNNFEVIHQQDREQEEEKTFLDIKIEEIKDSLTQELEKIKEQLSAKVDRINVHYPHTYRISFEEYNNLKPFLKDNISILRSK